VENFFASITKIAVLLRVERHPVQVPINARQLSVELTTDSLAAAQQNRNNLSALQRLVLLFQLR